MGRLVFEILLLEVGLGFMKEFVVTPLLILVTLIKNLVGVLFSTFLVGGLVSLLATIVIICLYYLSLFILARSFLLVFIMFVFPFQILFLVYLLPRHVDLIQTEVDQVAYHLESKAVGIDVSIIA